jgi:hypothetical protein
LPRPACWRSPGRGCPAGGAPDPEHTSVNIIIESRCCQNSITYTIFKRSRLKKFYPGVFFCKNFIYLNDLFLKSILPFTLLRYSFYFRSKNLRITVGVYHSAYIILDPDLIILKLGK